MPLKLSGSAQPVVPDRPQPRYTDENRPMGAKSILGGRQVLWAGPDWKWQSPKSFEKLKSSGRLNRTIFSDPLGVINNELRFIGRQVQDTNRRALQGPGGPVVSALRNISQGIPAIPGAGLNPLLMLAGQSQTGRNVIAGLTVGAQENAAKLGIALTQKVRGRPANPENSRANSLVERVSDAGYRVLGATPPGQQNQFERGLDAVARGTGAGVVGTVVAAKAIPAVGVGAAGMVATGGLRLAAGELISTMFDDNRGGNVANLGEAFGRPLPLAVDVGQDDWIDAGLKSLIPNAVPGLLLGGAGEAAGGFRSTRRWLSNRRTVAEVTDARTKLEKAGVTQTDPATGAAAFRQAEADAQARADAWMQAGGQDAPAQPQTAFGAMQAGGTEAPAPRPEPAPATRAEAEPAAAPAADAGGELEVEGLDIDPFDLVYDPTLPEADVVFNLVRNLDDAELQALLAQPGPVVPRIDELLTARQAMPVRPELEQGRVMAPAENVADRLDENGQPMTYQAQLERLKFPSLRDAAAPENNPQLAQIISDATGRDFEEFTKADIIEGLLRYEEVAGERFLIRDWTQSMRLTDELQADPIRFQFKQGITEEGEQIGNSLAGVDKWDTVAEEVLDVWTDPANGVTYVADGHNRLARAKQLRIPTMRTNELPAATATEARTLAAVANIKRGNGTVFDAAKFMRDSGITSPDQLQRLGAPMSDGHAARGLALSQLPDNIFQAAVDVRLSVGKAAALGGSGLDETQMQQAYKALSGKDMSDAKFNEIVQQVRNAPVVEGDQVDLFGNTEAMSLMGQKADLVTAIRNDLLKEKRVFGTAARGAGRLEQGGNVINVENSRAIAADAQTVLGMFDQLKYAPGPVGDMLNEGARLIADGAKPKVIADRIRGEVAEAVRRSLDEQGLPAARPAEAAEAATEPAALTPEQREAAQIEVIRRAVNEAEVRPPETPIPELPDGPALTPDLARADLEARAGEVEPGSPAAQALADEIRLSAEFAERDAQMRAIAEEGARDAIGYELKTFEEKKQLGMADGYDPEPVMPTEVMPRDTGPSIADLFEQQSRELAQSDARLYRRVGEGLQRMREGLDQLDQLDQLDDPALAPAPVRPEPLRLADGDEPTVQPRSKRADQTTRQQIQANEQRIAELRRKAQDEGCSL
jgi:hypothetical protein